MSQNEQFAYIEHNQIINCPVDYDFINNRNNSNDIYIPVLDIAGPVFDPIKQKLQTTYEFHTTHVKPVYKVLPRTIEELLADVSLTAIADAQGTPTLSIANIPVPYIMAVTNAVIVKVQQKLDNFAATRGYDSIGSVCTYYNSTYPKFRSEGQYAITLRDSTWTSLYYYLDQVQQGIAPVPTQWSDIDAVLPSPSWPA